MAAVSTPGSPEYHHYLGAGRFASTFGPTSDTIASARAWVSSAGLRPGTTSPDGLLIPVTGTTAQLERAFDVSLVSARLADGRVARFAPEQPRGAGLAGLPGDRRGGPLHGGHAPAPAGAGRPTRPGHHRAERVRTGPGRGARRRSGVVPVGGQPPVGSRPTSWPRRTGSPPCTEAGRTGRADHRDLRARAVYAVGHRHLRELLRDHHVGHRHPTSTGAPAPPSSWGRRRSTSRTSSGWPPDPPSRCSPVPRPGPTTPVPSTPTRPWWPTARSRSSPPAGACANRRWPCRGTSRPWSPSLFAEAAAQGQTVVAASGDSGSTDCYPGQPSTTAHRGRPGRPARRDRGGWHLPAVGRLAPDRDGVEQPLRIGRRRGLLGLRPAVLAVGAGGGRPVRPGPVRRPGTVELPGGARRLGLLRPGPRRTPSTARRAVPSPTAGTGGAGSWWAARAGPHPCGRPWWP